MEETGILIPFHGKTYMEALAPECQLFRMDVLQASDCNAP